MLSSFLLPILTLVFPIATLSLPKPTFQARTDQQPLHLPNNAREGHFRDVQRSDFPAIATLVVEAFSPSAAWHYLMPDLEHHKAEVRTCLLLQMEQGWETHDKQHTIGKVITVPHHNEDGKEEDLPVSIAVWHIRSQDQISNTNTATNINTNPNLNPFTPFSLPSLLQTCTPPPSTNLTRAASYAAQVTAIEQHYFSPEMYPSQLYLNLLATHPDWDGHGFGARQVEWGMNLSRTLESERKLDSSDSSLARDFSVARDSSLSLGMPVTLLATPAGWVLYDEMGFEGVKNATVEMVDGDGELWYEVMEWDG
jgi:hypothetical protein